MTDGATVRLTVGQAVVRFLTRQRSERDGVEQPLLAGCFGIFGHGNVAGVGQALLESADDPDGLRYFQARNEQGMVHTAVAYARMRRRLTTMACTASVGPGSTNMLTGAALATINRLPVLLLPSDVFATRVASPVLQELEDPGAADVSVNDAFRPVSRFFDRVSRPEQLPAALLGAMRVLTDPVQTGAVTLSLPQDVQTEAYDWPVELFADRVWHVPRAQPDPAALARAVELVRSARRPLVVAGGGVGYSEATEALRAFAEATGIPVAETQAGKGSLPYDHPLAVGAVGSTGTTAANIARPRGRPRHRGGHPLQRLHHRVADRLPGRRRAVPQRQRGRRGRRQARRHRARRRRPGSAGRPHPRARRLVGAGRARRAGRRARAGVGRDGAARVLPGPHPAAGPVGGHRRRQRGVPAARRRGVRGRLAARRPAQALADPGPAGLPRGVRLLLHGLRDRRRARRADGLPGPRRLRHGRRRLLPDDGPGAGHRRPGAHQDHRRAGAEPRLRLDRGAVRVAGLAALRHLLPLPRPGHREAGRRRAAGRPRRQRGEPRRPRAARRRHRRTGWPARRTAGGAVRRRPGAGARGDRPAGPRTRQRVVVGRPGRRGLAVGHDQGGPDRLRAAPGPTSATTSDAPADRRRRVPG